MQYPTIITWLKRHIRPMKEPQESSRKHSCGVQIMNGEKENHLDVVEMADLLFNDTSPGHCYASHRLLNEDRTFFKQVGRLPPKFVARSEAEVAAIRGRQEAELKVGTASDPAMPLCAVLSARPETLEVLGQADVNLLIPSPIVATSASLDLFSKVHISKFLPAQKAFNFKMAVLEGCAKPCLHVRHYVHKGLKTWLTLLLNDVWL